MLVLQNLFELNTLNRDSPPAKNGVVDTKIVQTPNASAETETQNVAVPNVSLSASSILTSIKVQGDLIRKMKEQKAGKDAVKAEVDELVRLKSDYKTATGVEWTAEIDSTLGGGDNVNNKATASKMSAVAPSIGNQQTSDIVGYDILRSIKAQGDTIRQMKEQKAGKETVKSEVDKLVGMKTDYKAVSGKEWTAELNAFVDKEPNAVDRLPTNAVSDNDPQPMAASASSSSTVCYDILKSIKTMGDTIRQMKEQKASKDVIKSEVDKLVAFKKDYKTLSGKEWTVELNTQV